VILGPGDHWTPFPRPGEMERNFEKVENGATHFFMNKPK
jgi:hypothetical protein